jgi:hypothetical protein
LRARIALLGCATLLIACADLHPDNGQLRCAADPQHRCPRGYHCELPSETCWKNGEAPSGDLGQPGDLGEADLTPALAKGAACTPGGMPCETGHCVDGVCCESTCADSCTACNLEGFLGDCERVPAGLPRGGRQACAGNGPCAGTCDGSSDGCSYPPASVHCGADCTGTCKGDGSCSTGGTGGCPGGFGCKSDGSGCLTQCDKLEDCQPNFVCNAPACARIPESDCLDGNDNNGDEKKDCDDPTCTALVTCVPGVAVGNELGLFGDASCAGDYGVSMALHQGFDPKACNACGCSVSTSCRNSVDFFSGASCTGGSSSTNIDGGNGSCTTVSAPGQPASIRFNEQTTLSSSCVPGAGSTPMTPSFASSKTFCAPSRQSASCTMGQVCVPKPMVPLCVRVPQTGASCPAGYTTNALGTWYGSYSDDRTCGCGTCSVTSGGTCPATRPNIFLSYSDAPTCVGAMGGGGNNAYINVSSYADPTTGCMNNATPGCTPIAGNCWGPLNTLYMVQTAGGTGGSCSRPGQVTSGSAMPTQGSTICCQ